MSDVTFSKFRRLAREWGFTLVPERSSKPLRTADASDGAYVFVRRDPKPLYFSAMFRDGRMSPGFFQAIRAFVRDAGVDTDATGKVVTHANGVHRRKAS